MRKAFDANVPKFRPRLRNAVAATELQEAAQREIFEKVRRSLKAAAGAAGA